MVKKLYKLRVMGFERKNRSFLVGINKVGGI